MKFLKTLFLFFVSMVIIGLNFNTISLVQIANASNFSYAYDFRLKLDEICLLYTSDSADE